MKKLPTVFRQVSVPYIILTLCILCTGWTLYLSYTSPISKALRSGERINGIIIGTDWVDYARHSDTLIFLSYDPQKRFLDIISIPRDTRFSPPGYNFRKINEIFAYHYRTAKDSHKASRELSHAVELLLGEAVAVPHYLQINYTAFKKIIDYMGGVTVEVTEPMHYDDTAGKLHIHFDPGVHHLDGQQALEYSRYRGPAGDIGRVFRQQLFFKSTLARWNNPRIIRHIPSIISLIKTEIATDLSWWDIINLTLEAKDFQSRNMRLAQLPGKYGRRGMWDPDFTAIAGLLKTIFPAAITTIPAITTTETESPSSASIDKIRVEVWNAAGKPKLAEEVTWLLRKNGFDVIDYGNFSTRQKKTLIKDISGSIEAAQSINEILQCGEVITRYENNRFIDVSVIIGEDYTTPQSPSVQNKTR